MRFELLKPLLAPIWRGFPEWLQWRLMWLLNAKFSVGVTGIVFDDNGKVMLLKHTFRRRYPWGLVSGWVSPAEALEAALLREIAEETDLSITIDQLFRVHTHPRHRSLEAVYLCRFRGGTFRPSSEISEIQWREPDDLPTGPSGIHPHQYPLIRQAAALRPAGPPSAVSHPSPGGPPDAASRH